MRFALLGLLETGGVTEQTHFPEGVAEAQTDRWGALAEVPGEAEGQMRLEQGDGP